MAHRKPVDPLLPMTAAFSPPTFCRLCGSTMLKARGIKRGKFRPLDFHFYECKSCTFLFVSPITGPEIYNDQYYRGQGPDPLVDYESEYKDYTATPRIYEFLDLYRLVGDHLALSAFSRKAVRWLDFGCGAGGLLKFLRDRKTVRIRNDVREIEASGYDVGSYANKLQTIDGLKIWDRQELEELPSDYFTIITCIEVIEHLPQPSLVFELFARLLGPNGLLLLSTGNLGSPLARLLGIAFPYCVPEIHVSYFNPRSLRIAYERVGLRPVKVQFLDGLRFKFLKNLGRVVPADLARALSRSKVLLRTLDFLYGVSAMPCATK